MLWEGHDARHWQRIWGAGDVHFFSSVTSTNDIVAGLATQGAPHLTIAVAEAQTRGRGRGGSRWQAPAGSSLLFSILFRTQRDGVAGAAPIRIGSAVAQAIKGASVKWPNDIVIPGHGKVAGILCEGTFGSHVVAGIGINVLQQPDDFPPELRGLATSVAAAVGTTSRAVLLTDVIMALKQVSDRLVTPLDRAELAAFRERDVLLGQEIVCEIAGGEKITGVANGIAEDGALLIEQGGSLRRLYNGTVRLATEQAYPGSVRLP